MKRVLLVAEDQLISNFHRVKFEAAGISVDIARGSEAARRLASERQPDLILLDPILSGITPPQTVEQLRGVLGEKPLWVISRLPVAVAAAVEKAGASQVLGRNGALDGDLLNLTCTALGMPPVDPAAHAEEHEAWIHSIAEAAPEAINSLRKTLHEFIKGTHDPALLYELFRQIHQLSLRVTMLHLDAVGRLTSAIEALVYDLYTMPEQINPSIVRTVSQSIDFLAVLFVEENLRRLQDPSSSDVFVVDDEAPARQIISAAMKLVNLKITCAADAGMALSVLEDNLFDLIFLDVNLPEVTGFDLCTQVRQIEDHRRTPIVFLTGLNTFQNSAKVSLSGCNDFIGKTFNLLELVVKALMWIFKGQLAVV